MTYEQRLLMVSGRLSDARSRDQVWADARAEDEDRDSLVEDRLTPSQAKVIDDDEARFRYDDNDEGGTRGGRE